MAKSKLKWFGIHAEEFPNIELYGSQVKLRSVADARVYAIRECMPIKKIKEVHIWQITEDGQVNRNGYNGKILFNRKSEVFVWVPWGTHYNGKIYVINPNTGQLGRRAYHGDY